jgi:hypothetical protein
MTSQKLPGHLGHPFAQRKIRGDARPDNGMQCMDDGKFLGWRHQVIFVLREDTSNFFRPLSMVKADEDLHFRVSGTVMIDV